MPPQPRFELFAYWRTSATYRVRVAMNLKGITPDERYFNFDTGGQGSEAFLKINPLGAIPALIDTQAPGRSQPLPSQTLPAGGPLRPRPRKTRSDESVDVIF